MKIFGFEIKKADKRANNGKNFTDEDRELSAEIREMRREYKRLQEERKLLMERDKIERLREDLGYYDEQTDITDKTENPETLLLNLLLPKILKGQSNINSSSSVMSPSEVTLSQEQIKQMVDNLPKKAVKYAKNMDDETKKQLIKTQMPNISNKSIKDILTYYNNKYS